MGYSITAETGTEAGNPKYTLRAGPKSHGELFTCPKCSTTVSVNDLSMHKSWCPFGPAALKDLLS